ncbi:MAG: septum formation initiator family protein [Desulfobacteraceae bacterium]|nr:septum formation initiator family protein [Desulfobacteraceae bacterium]
MTLFEKTTFYVGMMLILVLLFLIFFSKNGVMDYGKLKKQESGILVHAAQVAKENRKIEKEINSLKHDINYIKHLAKHEHEMAEAGELIFKNNSERKENMP